MQRLCRNHVCPFLRKPFLHFETAKALQQAANSGLKPLIRVLTCGLAFKG
jgi:hypothetical protein